VHVFFHVRCFVIELALMQAKCYSKMHLQEQKSKDGEELLFHGDIILIDRDQWS